MKVSTILVAAVAQVASAHYFFDTNIVNGVAQPSLKYVRGSTRPTKYNPIKFKSNPAVDIRDGSYIDSGDDSRCNQGAFTNAGKTDVFPVTAGDEVRLQLAVGAKFQHPGPGLVYMSKAPTGSVKQYDGSGDWFKIYQEGVCDTSKDFTKEAWCNYNRNYIAAKIPKDTPNGEYLLRVEHIGIHKSHVNQPEHYVSCMQIKVSGGGNGSPGPMVKFPGAYKDSDPYANFSIYNGVKPFTFPGPAVWGGSSSGTSPVTKPVTSPKPSSKPNGPTNFKPTTLSTVKTVNAVATAKPGCAALYGQCGGQGFTGATCCSKGSCKVANPYYSQCL